MRKQIARLTSIIFNPPVTAIISILLVSFEPTTSVFESLKWTLIVIALSILPLSLAVVYLVRTNRLDSVFAGIRQQRTKIYILWIILAIVGCVVLQCLAAPLALVALFLTAFVSGVIFGGINLWWKISLHTAIVATLITVAVISYGFIAVVSVVLLPLMIWSRVELGCHSAAEGITAAFLASLILILVFYSLGLI
jgi:hypothetical protein